MLFVVDEGPPCRPAYGHDPIGRAEEEPIRHDPPEPRSVGERPGMLGVEDRRPTAAEPGHRSVEERPISIGVDQVDSLLVQEARQAPHATEVHTGPTAEQPDREPLLPEPFSEDPQFIQAGEDEAVGPAQAPDDPRREHFNAAHLQRVDQLANRRRCSRHRLAPPALFFFFFLYHTINNPSLV